MEQAVLHGIHRSHTHAKITVTGQMALSPLLHAIADLNIPLGPLARRPAGWAFTVPRTAGALVAATLQSARPRLGFTRLALDERIAEVAVTGSGLRSDPAIRPIFCEALLRIGVHLELMSATADCLSVLCHDSQAIPATRALREALEIGITGLLLADDQSTCVTIQVDRKSG
ncbi:hypothetical protein N8J89_15360 [Crossiella sp. CA-258035]|uniref:hypothetical protein n=1 Tax=Crossiella sp. CA-258035 TaxID=2981138 RepID=UPI0024BC2D42|nr:hypothetical protein [Crossiella sp. CA-258035]WHT22388.1 hypothetical protein N8J89_15360 [Crossiella sp. CA-258035]